MDARHNSLRDWSANTCMACLGTPTLTEQHVPLWDRDTTDENWETEQAILDVVYSDPRTGAPMYIDAVVKCAHTDDPARLRARARKDGRAAAEAATGKRVRYPLGGASLIPFAFEDGGRPSEEAAAFVRMLAASRTEAEEGSVEWGGTARLWQECSTLLQLGNAEMVLSANGR